MVRNIWILLITIASAYFQVGAVTNISEIFGYWNNASYVPSGCCYPESIRITPGGNPTNPEMVIATFYFSPNNPQPDCINISSYVVNDIYNTTLQCNTPDDSFCEETNGPFQVVSDDEHTDEELFNSTNPSIQVWYGTYCYYFLLQASDPLYSLILSNSILIISGITLLAYL